MGQVSTKIVALKFPDYQNLQIHFLSKIAYTGVYVFLGGAIMRETNDPYADLEDLIYDEDEGLPSNR